jgi:ABC-type Fe3+-siderophore transport system permease subunit
MLVVAVLVAGVVGIVVGAVGTVGIVAVDVRNVVGKDEARIVVAE